MKFSHQHRIEEMTVALDGRALYVDAEVDLACVASYEDVEFEVETVTTEQVLDAAGEEVSLDADETRKVDDAIRAAMHAPKGTEAVQEKLVAIATMEGHRFAGHSRPQF